MAKIKTVDAEDLNNQDLDNYAGCLGSQVDHDELQTFLDFNFNQNNINEALGKPKFAQVIWGNAGIGKTTGVKSYHGKKVIWKGVETTWKVVDVPLAQFEEMGDLHGLPVRCCLIKKDQQEKWVESEYVGEYQRLGWSLDLNTPTRTKMSPPDWVPTQAGPTVLLFDDWNRASQRIIKGIMQLIQDYRTVSWSLPEGCQIVMTANPDQQEYLVTALDAAILTRCQHITLKNSVGTWVKWATQEKLDDRGICWILAHNEMMSPMGENKLTNPRTLSKFFSYSHLLKTDQEIIIHGNSLLDSETVTAFNVFLNSEYNLCIDPKDIFERNEVEINRIKGLMEGGKIKVKKSKKDAPEEVEKEIRIDVIHISIERLLLKMRRMKKEEITDTIVTNFQEFILSEWIPEDKINATLRRVTEFDKGAGSYWLQGGSSNSNSRIKKHVESFIAVR